MRSALYFPHTRVRSESLVRTALLQWDHLEFISPDLDYRPSYEDPVIAEAMELIGKPRTTNSEDRKRMHEFVEEFLDNLDFPDAFQYLTSVSEEDVNVFRIMAEKLAPETWKLLYSGQTGNLDTCPLHSSYYFVPDALGLTLMAVLADVLAGDTRARVTDQAEAYRAIANAPRQLGKEVSAHQHVVPLTLKGVNLESVSTQRLIEFRKREAGPEGHQYRGLRHKYLARVEAQVVALAKLERVEDRDELDRTFCEDMDKDFRDLKDELRFARNEAWLDRGFMTLVASSAASALALAGMGVMPEVYGPAGLAVSLAGSLGPVNKLAKSRLDIMQKHPMAYLYRLGH